MEEDARVRAEEVKAKEEARRKAHEQAEARRCAPPFDIPLPGVAWCTPENMSQRAKALHLERGEQP